jgi:hypothetical protein
MVIIKIDTATVTVTYSYLIRRGGTSNPYAYDQYIFAAITANIVHITFSKDAFISASYKRRIVVFKQQTVFSSISDYNCYN